MESSKTKRERVKIDLEDLPMIQNKTLKLIDDLCTEYELVGLHQNSWPFKYLYIREGQKYEFLFSQIGSFSIRVINSNIPEKFYQVVYYLSVGKYDTKDFVWETPEGKYTDVNLVNLKREIEKTLDIYEDSINL